MIMHIDNLEDEFGDDILKKLGLIKGERIIMCETVLDQMKMDWFLANADKIDLRKLESLLL